jgi:hypothetical protein
MDVSGQLHVLADLHQGKSPDTHRIRGWVGLRAGLDAVVKRIPRPCPDSNPVVRFIAYKPSLTQTVGIRS